MKKVRIEITLAARLNAPSSRKGSLSEIRLQYILLSSHRMVQNKNLIEQYHFIHIIEGRRTREVVT